MIEAWDYMKRHHGFALVELAVGLVLLLPVALVLLDFAVIVMSVQVNDSICREAARAAATGDPNNASARATAIVNVAKSGDRAFVSNIRLITVSSTVTAAELAKLTPYGGPVQGSVTVQTSIEVRPFIVQWAYNGKSPLIFHSKQTFPYSYSVPNTATSSMLRYSNFVEQSQSGQSSAG
jgi:Flp pilus assembly protein TadG